MLISTVVRLFADATLLSHISSSALLASMDPTQLESYYAEFVRYIQVNRLCQGKLLMDHGKLYSKLFSGYDDLVNVRLS